jgi:preprotein translocase subunit SecG
MIRIGRLLRDHSEAGAINSLISLWGFIDDRVFVTKGGAVGVVLRMNGPDWVLAKLLITVGASLLLMLHMQVVNTVAEAASSGALSVDHLRDPRMQLVADAGAASVVLLIAIVLSVFKPQGRTSFGGVQADGPQELASRTPMVYAFWFTVIALILAIVIRHLSGGIPGHH